MEDDEERRGYYRGNGEKRVGGVYGNRRQGGFVQIAKIMLLLQLRTWKN
jgi:hypothetical protein